MCCQILEEIRVTLSSSLTWTPLWPQSIWQPSTWLTGQFVESVGAVTKRPGCSSRRDGSWGRAYCGLEWFSWTYSEGVTGRQTLTTGVKGWLGQRARVTTGSSEYFPTIINKTNCAAQWRLENTSFIGKYHLLYHIQQVKTSLLYWNK